MFEKSNILSRSLFNRQINPNTKISSSTFWKKRLEEDFGLQINEEEMVFSSMQLYQYYDEYYQFIENAIDQLPNLEPRDIRDFLCDKNIGQGRLQIRLLKKMLLKPGAIEACLFQDNEDSSALEVALYTLHE